ncbi:hypothetical protein [Planctobacterium marinum]|uniref:hypothetical protein n=1 Tax=Planctobacterium marinum TaxID=1631968 RepID=UPI001E53D9B6|nr:hypothetical protein [Planctobacterium marinum]MCC2608139.1 hypothetical protein [Planctobacterium marinum]
MELVIFVLLFAGISTVCGLGYWLDHKFNTQVMGWMNMEVSSPFKSDVGLQSKREKRKNNEYQELRERIEILEKIVTDPRWELYQKIKNLS